MSLAFFWDDQLSWDSKRFCDDAMWPWQNVENGKLNHQPYQLIFAWAWSESQKAHKAWEVTTVSRLVEIYSKFQADSWNIQNLGSIDHICIWNYCWWFRNAAVPLISYIYIYKWNPLCQMGSPELLQLKTTGQHRPSADEVARADASFRSEKVKGL